MKERWNISPDVVWHDLDGALVLLHTGTGKYHGLNETGSQIFRLIAQGQTVTEVVEKLNRDYCVEPAQARAEVATLMGELGAAKLVS